jgi:hypothetical protein
MRNETGVQVKKNRNLKKHLASSKVRAHHLPELVGEKAWHIIN